jgi:hypothetical protein
LDAIASLDFIDRPSKRLQHSSILMVGASGGFDAHEAINFALKRVATAIPTIFYKIRSCSDQAICLAQKFRLIKCQILPSLNLFE